MTAQTCPRCGAAEQATHHPLCQERDGTPTNLSDQEVREALAVPVEDAVSRVALAAFHAGLGVGDFLSLNADALVAFGSRHGIPQAVMNCAWQHLQDRELTRMEREWQRAFAQLSPFERWMTEKGIAFSRGPRIQ